MTWCLFTFIWMWICRIGPWCCRDVCSSAKTNTRVTEIVNCSIQVFYWERWEIYFCWVFLFPNSQIAALFWNSFPYKTYFSYRFWPTERASVSDWDTAEIHCCFSQAGTFLRAVSNSTFSMCVPGFSSTYTCFKEREIGFRSTRYIYWSSMSKIMSRYLCASVTLAVVS